MKTFKSAVTLTLFAVFLTLNINAQTIVVPDTLNGWDQTWVANFNASQATFNNWSEGGVNTVSGTASTIYTKYFRSGKYTYGFRVNLRYGQAKINGQDVRKSDDLISIRNRFTYDLNEEKTYSAFGSIQFRSQFADGFEYGAASDGGDSLISGFMAPAYFTETAGIELTPNENLAFEAGLALKQTYIRNDDLSTIYGLSAGDNFRSEGGLSLGASYQNTIMDNILYYTSIETFTNFLMAVNKTDVFWSNEITGQINSMINAKFQFELRYDDDFSSEVQLKQVFAAGLTINLY